MIKYFFCLIFIFIFVFEVISQTDVLSPKLKQIWHFDNNELSEGFLLTNEGVIAFSLNGKIFLLDLDSGKVIWKNDIVGDFVVNPILLDDKLTVFSKTDEKSVNIQTLSLKTGIIIKTEIYEINSIPYYQLIETIQKTSTSDNGQSSYKTENNSLIKTKNNIVSWKIKLGGKVNDIFVTKNGILTSSTDNFLYLINEKSGNKLWKLRLNGKVLGVDMLSANIGIATVYGTNKLTIFNLQSGKLINTIFLNENEFNISKPKIFTQKVFIQTNIGIVCLAQK